MTEPDRTLWTDERIDDFVGQVWRAIDDLPNRMTLQEASELASTQRWERMEGELRALRKDFSDSRKGLTKAEKIALFSAAVAFIGVLIASAALVLS